MRLHSWHLDGRRCRRAELPFSSYPFLKITTPPLDLRAEDDFASSRFDSERRAETRRPIAPL